MNLADAAQRREPPVKTAQPDPCDFFRTLVWLDGRPLMETIELYRQRIFSGALYTFDADGRPTYNLALCGRAKKNWKSSDLILAGLYRFLAWRSDKGNDCFIIANDEDQAGDDLALLKKLIRANPILEAEVVIQAKEIVRRDGKGAMTILPARDAVGAHGKTYLYLGCDEIHGWRNYDLLEALAPDPSRHDALIWITSYAGIRHAPGIPLHDLQQAGKAGTDPRMFFSWYGGDFSTDPDFASLEPEQRANPSAPSWGNDGYLAQQRRRLPTHKYRRLHLNLPGAPDGAAFSAEHVMAAIVPGRKVLAPEQGQRYLAFVDMSGGSSDDAVLGISYRDRQRNKGVLACLVSQTGRPPFNPRKAIKKFVGVLDEYGVKNVIGDAYAGETFRADFQEAGITYELSPESKSEIYEEIEPVLNAGEAELLDVPEMQEQLLTLVWRGSKIDHQSGDHDDWANAACGALRLAAAKRGIIVTKRMLDLSAGRVRIGGAPAMPFQFRI